ncbi:hypothetical protein F5B22DRAFT_510037 [Xylaria bambusicola]|uniref:uncharacterized protein n=1 Tax=Xylaria bambusicola TaxID=326684 RepID=UPI002007E4E0|nr:uncharacterized protein F5B22DRAFT_510037 [Xylaria bambusicola]KAI0521910.1 hypothetical protein F5B22DRAFT_510037 [Xylaria bambusicola]
MNWTEGSLARHSRGKQRNALIARQKQHFARARSGLLNTRPQRGPPSISFLPSKPNPDLTSESTHRTPKPWSYDERLSTPPLPPSIRASRQEHPTDILDVHPEEVLTSFNRRKRLLEKSDWAGLKLQEPLNISFPGQIYATRRWSKIASPRDNALNESQKLTLSYEHERYNQEQSRHLKRSSMRIQIGSQEIQPSIETCSQPSAKWYILEPDSSAHEAPYRSIAASTIQSSGRAEYGDRSASSVNRSLILSCCFSRDQPPVNVIYSSPAIIEPVPRRYFHSKTQQWLSPSSEDGESIQVEIERPVRPVPPSQASENRRWKNWVSYEKNSDLLSDSAVTAIATSEIHAQDSESSIITLPSHLQFRLPSFCLSSEPDAALRYSGAVPSPEPSPESSPIHVSNRSPKGSHDIHPAGEYLPGKYNSLPSKRQCKPAKKRESTDDLNETWRKFAYGEGEDSEELLNNAFKEAAHQAAVELRPSDTSDSADMYTETAATCGTELSPGDRQDDYNETSSESHLHMRRMTCSEAALSTIATVGSSVGLSAKSASFVLPKSFVGKYADIERTPAVRPFNAGMSRDERGGRRKRRKKMTTDGRTNIRCLPDFDEDPIEEIED